MADPARLSEKWINPLLERLDLVQPKRASLDLRQLWSDLEEYGVLDRIHAVVASVNHHAGHHVLQLLDYLPPQRSVLRVVFTRNKVEYAMSILLLSHGAAVTFHCARVSVSRWDRYIPGRSPARDRPAEAILGFRPQDISDEIIQSWFSFLLSGFSREADAELRGLLLPPANGSSDSPFSKKSA